jgi:hypothetical protein
VIIKGFIALLQADATVAALTEGRAYADALPRGYVFPALVLHEYGGSLDSQMDGPADAEYTSVQVDIYGSATDERDNLRKAVGDVMDGYVGTLPNGVVVQLCSLERKMDLQVLPSAERKTQGFRSLRGYSVTSNRV